jgi:hypothetical protein
LSSPDALKQLYFRAEKYGFRSGPFQRPDRSFRNS